jgi:hypothetical protein
MKIELSPSVFNSDVFVYSDGGSAKSKLKEHRDCTVIAFVHLSNRPYVEAHRACKQFGRKNRRGFQNFAAAAPKVAKVLGLELKLVKRSGTLGKLIAQYPQENLLVTVQGHAFALKAGTVYDTFAQGLRRRIKQAWIVSNAQEVTA